LKNLRGEKTAHTEAEDLAALGVRRRPKVDHDIVQATVVEPLPKLKVDPVPVVPLPAPKVRPATQERIEKIAPNGMRIIEKSPVEAAPVLPEEPQDFMEKFTTLKERMWDYSIQWDELERDAPALFKSVVGQFRDRLLGLLQELG
jgi:hypothetical protein